MHLLDVRRSNGSNVTKEDIEKAFRVAAKRHHPDSAAKANPIKFRQCLEARNLLLDHYHNVDRGRRQNRIRNSTTAASRSQQPPGYHQNYYGHSFYYYFRKLRQDTTGNVFVKGFPFQTLHLLTTKSKLQIKGATMVLILTMGLYDGYTRRLKRQTNQRSREAA